MIEQLTMRQLLDRWRTELIAAELTSQELIDHRKQASTTDLDSVEARLGVSLPPSYREFLSISDGWSVCGGFVTGLRSTARVGWFRDAESEWLEIWRDIAADADPDDRGPDVELMARALVVSEPGDQALLLDPNDVDAATGEWACYTFSNWAPGANQVGRSFRAGLDHVYRDFVADHDVASESLTEAGDVVEQAYQAMLAGDLTARARLDDELRLSWRAWLLAAQFDALGARPGASDFSTSINHLWWGHHGAVTTQDALADPVLMNELLPLYVVRLIEADLNIDWEIHRAPDTVANRMRTYRAQISAGSGILADFSYAPGFAEIAEQARLQIRSGDQDVAWATVEAGLPTWTPMSDNHLAPLGLYYDNDLRQLLTPPPPRATPSPATNGTGQRFIITRISRPNLDNEPTGPSASVVRLSSRKLHSTRTLAVLETPFRPASTS